MRALRLLSAVALAMAATACDSRGGGILAIQPPSGGNGGGNGAGPALNTLALSQGALSPAFASGTTSYSASVPNTTTAVTVTASAASGNTIAVNGSVISNPGTSPPVALAVGANTIAIGVASAAGTARSYTVSVTRAAQ